MTSHVVRFEVFGADRAPDSRWAILAEPYEHARVDALRDPSDRLAYISAHLLVRDVAAELLGRAVNELVLSQQCPGCGVSGHGRPVLEEHCDVALSLSHSVHRHPGHPDRIAVAAIAAASTTPVGVDVEFRGARVPDRALTPTERAAVAGGVDPVMMWTRKEACVKAGVATLDTVAELDVWAHPDPALAFTDWVTDGASDGVTDEHPDVAGCWVRRR